MQETWVHSLGQEDPLEKGMANHSSILAWKILWTKKPGELQSMESQESDMTKQLTYFHIHTTTLGSVGLFQFMFSQNLLHRALFLFFRVPFSV